MVFRIELDEESGMVKELASAILDASSVGGFLVTSTGSRRLLAEKESDGE